MTYALHKKIHICMSQKKYFMQKTLSKKQLLTVINYTITLTSKLHPIQHILFEHSGYQKVPCL